VIFQTKGDYYEFERVLIQALQRVPIRLLAYSAMPNHWHLLVWPRADHELPRFMHWLTMTHAQRWHQRHLSTGTGAVYQGRYKAIPIQSESHFLVACRYVERNPLRAGLVANAEDWRWSSIWRRRHSCLDGIVHECPTPLPERWMTFVNEPQTEQELHACREAVRRNLPLGDADWQQRAGIVIGPNGTARGRGRPRKVG
jgi:putative transposase